MRDESGHFEEIERILRDWPLGSPESGGRRATKILSSAGASECSKAALEAVPAQPIRDMLSDLADYVVARIT